ncbi:MAG: type I-E CRISPR-associated protein Cse1/CasA [Magnetococcales bacterium]|nr:type I-E CRISPR-associated protein Cse1/CasA [Magnetococcales bacterium]
MGDRVGRREMDTINQRNVTMNLITDRWLPVRRADGQQERISPVDITADLQTNPIIALDYPRPDFNGAMMQFLIGLLQTIYAPEDDEEWRERLNDPPTPELLSPVMMQVAAAFNLDGDGPRFMQDFDTTLSGESVKIASLLIEAPGEQTVKLGKDLFQKRRYVTGLCLACSAAALFTLHTNAPSGGAGHRTSLRGGGPLTTLVVPDPREKNYATLWAQLWWNMLDKSAFLSDWLGNNQEISWFPWLAATRTSKEGQTVTPADAHPAIAYWSMPRRIRLDFTTTTSGQCDLCGDLTERLLSQYITRPYGMNGAGWNHPLSPYYQDKKTGWLPTHPQPGGIAYHHWLELTLGQEEEYRPAQVIQVSRQRKSRMPKLLWAFGYDMDNMKARCWYEARLPLIDVPPEQRSLLAGLAQQMVAGADTVKSFLTKSLRNAWFSTGATVRGDFSFISQSFWASTTEGFYQSLWQFTDGVANPTIDLASLKQEISLEWRNLLATKALHLFELWATHGAVEYENPKRIAQAYHMLRRSLYGPLLKKALGLPIEEKALRMRRGERKT